MKNRSGTGQTPDTQALSRRDMLALSSIALVESRIAGAVSDSAPGSQELFAYVDELYELKRQAYRTADPELFTRFYCDDVIIAGERFPLTEGIENVLTLYRKILPTMRDAVVEPIYRVAAPSGEMGYDFVKFRPVPKSAPQEPDTSTLLFIWKKVAQEWRCCAEIVLQSELALTQAGA